MKQKMDCTGYFPGCYSRQDFNRTVNDGTWPAYNNFISMNTSGLSYNNFSHQPNLDQIGVVYHNEMARRMILRHEYLFREQVQELHRLHRRQRELMDEYKRRRIKEINFEPMMSHYSFILPKVSPDRALMTWQTPTGPTLSCINPAAKKLSCPGSNNALSTISFLDISPKNEDCFENKFTPPKCRKPRLKMLDLELPADNYIDSDEENGNEVQTKTSHCSNDKNDNVMAFDLNMPPTLSLESEILQTSMDLEIGTKACHNTNPNKEREEIVISQVCDVESKVSKNYLIDLNSCVDEDEPSPTLSISKTTVTMSKIDLEPVSPENKESLPPRGESEENLLETKAQISKQDDIVAAETIILMSKLSFNEKTLASDIESLDWFAGIVISSVANYMEDHEKGMSSDGREKKETKCVVALPSQHGKRHGKRRNGKINKKRGDFRSLSSLMNYGLGSGEKDLKSWVKVSKRQRGPRVPVSSIRLLWSELQK